MSSYSFFFRTTTTLLLSFTITGTMPGCSAEAMTGSDPASPDGPSNESVPVSADSCGPGSKKPAQPETCNGIDDNCDGYIDRDLMPSDCAKLLLQYVGIVAQTQAAQGDLTTRVTPLGCPAESGMGEATLNIFSYTGPLPKSCNRMILDDCNDPERQNYWVMVGADRRNTASYSYQVMWGSEPNQYSYYGACWPEGLDNSSSRVPKRLMPIRDADGDGKITACGENHVAWVGFETGDPQNPQPVLIKDIADVANLRVSDKKSLDLSVAEQEKELESYQNLLAEVKGPGPSAQWKTARVIANMGSPWLRWKDSFICK